MIPLCASFHPLTYNLYSTLGPSLAPFQFWPRHFLPHILSCTSACVPHHCSAVSVWLTIFRPLELSIDSSLSLPLLIHVLGTYCVLYISPYCLPVTSLHTPFAFHYGSFSSYDPSICSLAIAHLATPSSSGCPSII